MTITRWRIPVVIKRVEHRRRTVQTWKDGDNIRSIDEDIGWWVVLEGSWEALYLGNEEPPLFGGQRATIILEVKT
jgi:hypothetical protein